MWEELTYINRRKTRGRDERDDSAVLPNLQGPGTSAASR